jgi:DNA gyrase/topoisomerase IV subunit B
MSKLVDKERLAKLAKALDQRMKAAVSAEEQRALAAEAKALEDAIKADEIFSVLMGENVEPRREFIESNAKYVTNFSHKILSSFS